MTTSWLVGDDAYIFPKMRVNGRTIQASSFTIEHISDKVFASGYTGVLSNFCNYAILYPKLCASL